MKKILVLTAVFLALPVSALAATYDYVNTSGQMASVVADNSTQAFANATNIAPHSGVMLESGIVVMNTVNTFPGDTYQYVNVNGVVETVEAPNSAQALALATDIAPHSGVMQVAATGTAIPASSSVPI